MKNEITIKTKCFIINEDMEKVLKILKKWGLTQSLCDADLFEMIEEIVYNIKMDEENIS